jgi:hypothetical protein
VRWHVQPTPNPRSATGNFLAAVSCSSPRACTAVGGHGTGQGDVPLAERWNGKRWALQPTPRLPGFFPVLEGVSCPSSRECLAVGGGFSASLAERWDGSRWSVQQTPSPTGTQIELTSVACPRPADCIAVGGYQDPGRIPHPLALRWDGHSWQLIRAMPPPPGIGVLAAVACSGPAACTAVGS